LNWVGEAVERVRDYELKAFFTYVIDVLERLDIPYMVVGGFAAIFYGEPRLTLDVDSATFITPEDIILAKLIAFRETGSDKHLRDARGVLIIQWGKLNLEAVRRGARAAGTLDQLEALLEAARYGSEGQQ